MDHIEQNIEEEKELDLLAGPDGKIMEIVDILPPPIENGYKAVPLSPRAKQAIRMVASGLKRNVVAQLLGLTKGSVDIYINCAEGQEYLTSLQKSLDTEFKLLMRKVTTVVDRALDSADIGTALKAADFWAKYSGQFSQKIEVALTAEDIVKKLMEGVSNGPSSPVQEGDRRLVPDTEQGRGDSPVYIEQRPGGHRLDPDV